MLQVRDVSKWHGDNLVLNRVSFVLNRGDRAGLIGPNGSGKSTLVRIIVGELTADSGAVLYMPASLRLGYLPQALEFEEGATVADILRAAEGEREASETRLERLAQMIAITEGEAMEEALEAYSRALEAYDATGGERERAGADALLAGLGMDDVHQDRPVASLSGGQKTRLGLVRLLLTQPDLLVLDEPTNHLDIVALRWLESYLTNYPGAVLVISHDRTFLDQIVRRILALDEQTHTLREYAGSYTDYALAVDRELNSQWAMYREQQLRVQQLEGSIAKLSGKARNIEHETIHFYWRRIAKDLARRAVVQKRRLERMLEDEDLVEKPGLTWKMKLEFPDMPRSGQDVLHITGLRAGYGERVLFDNTTLHLRYGERAVLVGANGTGKTTLLRCIMGIVQPQAGEIKLGRGVRPGYMAQEQETLNSAVTPFDLLRKTAPFDETEARNFLHYFLFGGDDVFVPVGRLSYGERSKLTLALLAAQGCNFLLLDEPINHLDIASRESFERAMARFAGTVLAVVHDRYFIDRFATTVWMLEDGRISA